MSSDRPPAEVPPPSPGPGGAQSMPTIPDSHLSGQTDPAQNVLVLPPAAAPSQAPASSSSSAPAPGPAPPGSLGRIAASGPAHILPPTYGSSNPDGYAPLPGFGLDLSAARTPYGPNSRPSVGSPPSGTKHNFSPLVPGFPQFKPKKSKRAKTRIDDSDRQRICQHAIANPGLKQGDIAALFNLERSTVSKILKNKERYLALKLDESYLKRDRSIRRPALEGKLLAYVHWLASEGKPPPDNNSLRAKATEIDVQQRASAGGCPDAEASTSGSTTSGINSDVPFVPSDTWLTAFRVRHRLDPSGAGDSTSNKRSGTQLSMMPSSKRRASAAAWNEWGQAQPAVYGQSPLYPQLNNSTAHQWHSTPPPSTMGPITLRDADQAVSTLMQFLSEQPAGSFPDHAHHHFSLGALHAVISRMFHGQRPTSVASYSQAANAGFGLPPGANSALNPGARPAYMGHTTFSQPPPQTVPPLPPHANLGPSGRSSLGHTQSPVPSSGVRYDNEYPNRPNGFVPTPPNAEPMQTQEPNTPSPLSQQPSNLVDSATAAPPAVTTNAMAPVQNNRAPAPHSPRSPRKSISPRTPNEKVAGAVPQPPSPQPPPMTTTFEPRAVGPAPAATAAPST